MGVVMVVDLDTRGGVVLEMTRGVERWFVEMMIGIGTITIAGMMVEWVVAMDTMGAELMVEVSREEPRKMKSTGTMKRI